MAMLAGMVTGTPDWQLDRAYELDTAAVLEKAYAEDDFPVSIIADEFSRSKYYIGLALDHMIRAAKEADKYGKAAPIDDLIDKMESDIEDEMNKILRRYKEGA